MPTCPLLRYDNGLQAEMQASGRREAELLRSLRIKAYLLEKILAGEKTTRTPLRMLRTEKQCTRSRSGFGAVIHGN